MALGAFILVVVGAAGACVVAFVNTGAEPELRVALAEIEPGVPRFEPITSWGADDDQFTYGIWVTQIARVGTRAYFSRDVNSGCHIQWRATEQVGAVTGVFRDPCSGSLYDLGGGAIGGPATRDLDTFDVEARPGVVVIDFSVLHIGDCRADADPDEPICNPPDGTTTRSVPRNTALPNDFARR